MAEEVNNIIEEENTSQVNSGDDILTDEQLKENEEAYEEALERLNSYGLSWTFRSIRYVIDREGIGFSQLRGCVYFKDNQAYFDFMRSVIALIKAGLVGSKQIQESDAKALEDRAYEIIEDWRENIGSLQSLHLMLINIMETRHFFMGMADMKIVQHLSYKNLQKDLARTIIGQDIREKMSQAKALAGKA